MGFLDEETTVGVGLFVILMWLIIYAYGFSLVISNFHMEKYHKKIQDVLFYWYISEALSGRPWKEIQHLVDPKKVSAWNMKKQVKNGLTLKIRTESEARVAAKNLFQNVAKPGSEFIDLEDLTRFLPENDALATLSIFDQTTEGETTQISCSYLQQLMVYAFRLEKSLVLTMKDTDSVISRTRTILYLVSGIAHVIIWIPLLLLGLDWLDGWRYQLFVVYIFVVCFPIKIYMDSILFHRSIHFFFFRLPYDVGQRCLIDKDEFVVKKINLSSTTFIGLDNKEYELSSSTLMRKMIGSFEGSLRLEKIGLILSRLQEDGKDTSTGDAPENNSQ